MAKALAWQFGLSNGDFLLSMHAGVVAGPAGAIDGKRVVYMAPPAERVPAPNTQWPVVAIVFPRL